MLLLVGHDQHRWVVGCPFHVLPSGATAEGAALVVAPARKVSVRSILGPFVGDPVAKENEEVPPLTWDKGSP